MKRRRHTPEQIIRNLRLNAIVADQALRARLREISAERPRWGYRRARAILTDDGWEVNRKRAQRLWRDEGLRVPRRRRKRQRLGDSTVPAERLRAERPNHVWALDFQFDQTADGRDRVVRVSGHPAIVLPRCAGGRHFQVRARARSMLRRRRLRLA